MNPLERRLADIVVPVLNDLGYELVRLAVLGRETPTVQIMADHSDGRLISVEDCEKISNAVSAVLDVEDPIPGKWSLEVSSAGIDRPLTRPKDWERFTGHLAKVEMEAPLEGRRRFAGPITGLRGQEALLRLEDGTEVALPLGAMRKARLVLTDALLKEGAPSKAGAEANGENAANQEDIH
ncbi:ribosome maturation factor RimP [Formicincola oecophyllae]